MNYYPKISVADIQIEDHAINKNDLITIQGPTTGNYELKVLEMKNDLGFTDIAPKGKVIGIKVWKKVRRNDQVYNIVEKK